MNHPSAERPSVGLALGTVQFGLAYGVAGRGEVVPDDEARTIIEYAARAGIGVLDTAPVYGDIEARLGGLIDGLNVEVVSKVGPLPAAADVDAAARFVEESITRSERRLGPRLKTILFHRAEDLLGSVGDAAWRAAETASHGRLRLGASCYAPVTLVELRRRYPIAVAQLPGNAFDQRLAAPSVVGALQGVEVHARSVFLQGLLLMPRDEAIKRVPAAARPMAAWEEWCARHDRRPILAALSVAHDLPSVRLCVVGVDRLEQLQEIVSAWEMIAPCSAPLLACESLDVIDPRRWASA